MNKDNEKVNMKVYDVPVELKNKYISMAKLDHDNQMWKVLEKGMSMMEDERNNKVPRLEERVERLEKQLVYLKSRVEESEASQQDEEAGVQTFGG